MSTKLVTLEITLEPSDNRRLASLCGPFDDNIKLLERRLGVEINHRSDLFTVVGKAHTASATIDILRTLYVDTAPVRGHIPDLEQEQVHLAIKESGVLEQNTESNIAYGKEVFIKTKKGLIKPRTPNQAQYLMNMVTHDITFGIGPAGRYHLYDTKKEVFLVSSVASRYQKSLLVSVVLYQPTRKISFQK